jgi:Replicase family/Primase C terminal 1 (PriCT-1)
MIPAHAAYLFGGDRLPKKPYCTNSFERGVVIRPRDQAVKYTYIQPNPPNVLLRLVFDVDGDDAFAAVRWESVGCPPPNWTASRLQSPPRPHMAWELGFPVLLADAGHSRQARFCVAVESALRAKLGADPCYSGNLCKNPLSKNWKVVWWHSGLYTLSELAEYLPLDQRLPKIGRWKPEFSYGVGRNVTLFARLGPEGGWAYREVHRFWDRSLKEFFESVLEKAVELNGEFHVPLGWSEVRGIAQSIARWTWRRFSREGLRGWHSERGRAGMRSQMNSLKEDSGPTQAARGVRSGEARHQRVSAPRAEARLLAAQGHSTREIAIELGVPQSNVAMWVRPVDK